MFERLAAPGPRLPWLVDWLTSCVWSRERFASLQAERYLLDGERMVNDLEEVIAAAAPRCYDEMLVPPAGRGVLEAIERENRLSVVIFDGLSLREVPALVRLTEQSALRVVEQAVSTAAVPSETVDFIEQRLRLPRVAPSQLPGRRDLADRGLAAYYYSHPGERHVLDGAALTLLLWSAFPDNTYKDSGARFETHFAQIRHWLEPAWNATVMSLPRDRRVLITSDHGYVFLGSGLSFSRSREELRPLADYFGSDRAARLSTSGEPPAHRDIATYPDRDAAMLKGRIHPHTSGPASNRLYRHGGLSLMEMLTPWLLLEA
jgi:hypothetical protein